MPELIVTGGARLRGEITAHGSKNAALPILAASLLIPEPICLYRCPQLLDVFAMLDILRALGVRAEWFGDELWVDSSDADTHALPETLSREMRSSIFLLGPVLGRFGEAVVTYPGGCAIGSRPIDLHLEGLKRLNATVCEDDGRLRCTGKPLLGNTVHLAYPSVGATENLMLAACTARGRTVISGAAREPEVVELQKFLNAGGFAVSGAGTSAIAIEGGRTGRGLSFPVMPDRIVAGTWLVAGAITRGDITVRGANTGQLKAVLDVLRESGCDIRESREGIRLIGPDRPKALTRLDTQPYPGFPTDMQSQLLALCSVAEGESRIHENVFENRFKIAEELRRMGGDNAICDRTATVHGVACLHGADVEASDLRGGAALVLAGLRAEGQTRVRRVDRIDRGYERIEDALTALGAQIKRT
ncbi:MAG: UDP-N-acetylglucosamine 1-carboxyvinyltransferase [Clostridiales bacterium]|nr:UDP-N-acetylglucosamine 1-carboxyvinyltransferase [Clostridiales bacterium]